MSDKKNKSSITEIINENLIKNVNTTGKLVRVMAIFVILVLATITLKNLSSIFKPLIIALFFVLMMQPLVQLLNKKIKIPILTGYLIVFVLYIGIFYFFGTLISESLSNFSKNFPAYEKKINSILKYVNSKIKLIPGDLTVNNLIKNIPSNIYNDLISITANTFINVVSFLLFTLILMLFFLLETKNFKNRLNKAIGENKANQTLKLYGNITSGIKNYLVSKIFMNFVTTVYAAIIMAIFGIDFWVIWAFLLFLLLWIPYIGSVIGAFAPIFISFLQFNIMWKPILFTILLITGLAIFGNIIETRFMGKRLNLSPLLVLISMTFFGWLWGVLGVLLAVPIVGGIKIVLENFSTTKPIGLLMSEALNDK